MLPAQIDDISDHRLVSNENHFIHERLGLFVRPVATQAEVETMRQIRNACRHWMTRHRNFISALQQIQWWKSRPLELQAFLYSVEHEPVGFGLLRLENGKSWATLGILAPWRSKGIGTAIYRHLITTCENTLWIEVRNDNIASFTAATKAGFELVSEDSAIRVLKAEGRKT